MLLLLLTQNEKKVRHVVWNKGQRFLHIWKMFLICFVENENKQILITLSDDDGGGGLQ